MISKKKPGSKERRLYLCGCVWGFLEATLFFFVPDIWISFEARKKLGERTFRLIGYTLLGALFGGLCMYVLGQRVYEFMYTLLVRIPAINATMMESVEASVTQRGIVSLLWGPLQGVPYKIYAVYWGRGGGNLFAFLLLSIPARGIRFVASAVITRGISTVCERVFVQWRLITGIVLGVFWFIFYMWYFIHFI